MNRVTQDIVCLLGILALSFWVFASGADKLGFYADDAIFLTQLPGKGVGATVEAAAQYVPGRELHIIWQQFLFLVCGSSSMDLPKLHLAQTGLDAVAGGLLFVLLRLISVPSLAAAVGALLFVVYPNHGETHFWLSSAPMNIVSTIFLLGYMISVVLVLKREDTACGKPRRIALSFAECALFICAIFTYDQCLFAALALACVRCLYGLWRGGWKDKTVLFSCALYALVSVAYLIHKTSPGGHCGPFLSMESLLRLKANAISALSLTFGNSLYDTAKASLSFEGKSVALRTALAVGIPCLAMFVWLIAGSKRAYPNATARIRMGGEWRGCVVALVAAVVGFLLSYLPACLWYISLRHNYLPTLFVCGGAGLLFALLMVALSRCRSVIRWVGLVVASTFVACAVAIGAACNVNEKEIWSDNYQARLAFYSDLYRTATLKDQKVLVLDGFPGGYHGSQFFAWEQAVAAPYAAGLNCSLPGTSYALEQTALNAFPGLRGVFIHTEAARWGAVNIRYFPRKDVLWLKYDDVRVGRIHYTPMRCEIEDVDRVVLATISNAPSETLSLGPGLLDMLSLSQAGDCYLTMKMSPRLHGLVLPKGEAVACLLSFQNEQPVGTSQSFTPLTKDNLPHGPNYQPVPLLEGYELGKTESVQDLEQIGIPIGRSVNAVKVALYKCSAGEPVLLGERVLPVMREDQTRSDH